jgi:hypothetical protein
MAAAELSPVPDESRRAAAAEQRISSFRQILSTAQWGWIEGVPVEVQTASQVVTMHDNLSALARELYRRMDAKRMVDLAYDHSLHQARSRGRRR